MSRKNPCFDESTGKDCADRCAGCAGNCKKWSKHVKERNKSYNEVNPDKVYESYKFDTLSKIRADRQKDKRHGRMGIMK